MLKKILNFVTVSSAKITTKSIFGGWEGYELQATLCVVFLGQFSVDTNCLQSICNFPCYSQCDGYWYFQLER